MAASFILLFLLLGGVRHLGRSLHAGTVDRKGIAAVHKLASVSVADTMQQMQDEVKADEEAAAEKAAAEKEAEQKAAQEQMQAQEDQLKVQIAAQLDADAVPATTGAELASYEQKFADTVFFGDSMTEAMSAYGFIDASRTVYHRGASIASLTKYIQGVIDIYPKRLVMFTGLNDCSYYQDVQAYINDYVAMIGQIKASLPDVQIYVCSVLPPNDAIKATRTDLARSDAFDTALATTCSQQGWTYIDTKWMVRPGRYEQDGIHVDAVFYEAYFRYLYSIL